VSRSVSVTYLGPTAESQLNGRLLIRIPPSGATVVVDARFVSASMSSAEGHIIAELLVLVVIGAVALAKQFAP